MKNFNQICDFLYKFAKGGICPTTNEKVNGHEVEASWEGGDLVGFNIDGKEYGGFTDAYGSLQLDNEEKSEVEALLCNADGDITVTLATTQNGVDIAIDPETMEHLKAHSNLDLDNIKEAIGKTTLEIPDVDSFCKNAVTVDLQRYVGRSGIKTIEAGDNDQWLYRLNREGRSHVIIMDRKRGDKTSKVFLVLGHIPDKGNYLFTASYGEAAPMEPWDEHLPEEDKEASIEFWNTHAIVVLNNEIDWGKEA